MAISTQITTNRLHLEPFSERHLTARYIGWLNDPEVTRFSEQRHKRHTLETAASYMRSFDGTPNYFWAIVANDLSLGHIGNINAYVDPFNKVADVGLLIGHKAAWGKGYGSEAWEAVCRFLLNDMSIRKVTGGTVSTNMAMLAVMRRAGMQDDGVRPCHVIVDGEAADLVHFALFRKENGSPR